MSTSCQALLQSAIAYHQQGDLASAIAGYEAVLAYEPRHVDALANLASALKQAGRPTEALARFQEALTLNGDLPQVWFNYANLLHAQHQLAAAERAYRHALALAPTLYPAHFNLGRLLHQQDRIAEAEGHYRETLRLNPSFARAYTNLGNLLRSQARLKDAIAAHQEAIRLAPDQADAYINLGNALQAAGKTAAAQVVYREAMARAPGSVLAALALARLLHQTDDPGQAEAILRQALTVHPQAPQLLRQLAGLLYSAKRFAEAVELYRRALSAEPNHADTLNALGVAIYELGGVEETLACWQRAVALDPKHATAHTNLGTLYRALKRHREALDHLSEAVRLAPDETLAQASLAHTMLEIGHISEALAILDRLTTEHPQCFDGYMAQGHALVLQGWTEEALAALERARQLNPDSNAALSNYLFTLLYSDRYDAKTITRRHRELAAQLEAQTRVRFAPPVAAKPKRPLQVGYLSPDLRRHPVAFFLEPILTHHDPTQVQVTCYSLTAAADETTTRLRRWVARWCDCHGWSDERLGDQIQKDGIDILVELAGHTASNRMSLLARRPAPVQALYLGYPCTSGLASIDYLLGDRWVTPPALAHLYSERVMAVEGCFLCFNPYPDAPPVMPAPVLDTGYITFGCFNNLAKVSATCLTLWARVLQAVPNACLALKALSLTDAGTREQLWARFEALGIERRRIELLPPSRPIAAYLADYQRIDIGLDPLPYTGGTTTCDALWMGIPVITLAGEHFYSRMGLSILQNVGLPELVARTAEEYIAIAVRLAADPVRLGELREGLRERLQASPLCDGSGFTRRFEAAYRAMWQEQGIGASGARARNAVVMDKPGTDMNG